MKTIVIIVAILDILLLLSTLICGLWIAGQNLTGDELASSRDFHRKLGIVTIILSLVAVLWMLIAYVR